jgi:hypothetical protein
MPELDSVTILLRRDFEKAIQPFAIKAEVRRQLPQNWAALLLQEFRSVEEHFN